MKNFDSWLCYDTKYDEAEVAEMMIEDRTNELIKTDYNPAKLIAEAVSELTVKENLEMAEYVKENDANSIDADDDTYNYVIQRESAMRNLMNQRLKVVMPGNFDLISGTNVNITVPTTSEQSSEKNQDNMDKSKSGKYLIVAARQMITYDKHETILEVATDSSNRDRVYLSTQQQNDLADFYG